MANDDNGVKEKQPNPFDPQRLRIGARFDERGACSVRSV